MVSHGFPTISIPGDPVRPWDKRCRESMIRAMRTTRRPRANLAKRTKRSTWDMSGIEKSEK